MEGYHHLTHDERVKIETLRAEGLGVSEIADRLCRPRCTISRELRRNGNLDGTYNVKSAQRRASQRCRGKPPRLIIPAGPAQPQGNLEWQALMDGFDRGWSPEQIAGRFALEHPGATLCHETIYRFIYSKEQRSERLWQNLPRGHAKRRKRKERSAIRAKIPGRTGIEQRPAAANERSEVGHWEGDLVCFSKCREVVLHVVERSVRFGIALKLFSKEAQPLIRALIAAFDQLPSILRETITFDNGSEFSAHQLLNEELGIDTYFCHSYALWEKGTVENQNGVLRRYLPRKTDMSGLTQDELTEIREEMNDRPLKCLGWKTPREMLFSLTGLSVALHV